MKVKDAFYLSINGGIYLSAIDSIFWNYVGNLYTNIKEKLIRVVVI